MIYRYTNVTDLDIYNFVELLFLTLENNSLIVKHLPIPTFKSQAFMRLCFYYIASLAVHEN